MRYLKIAGLVLLFTFAACTSHKTGPKVRLALNLQKGHTYKLESNITQNMQQTVHDMEQKITTSVKGLLSFKVKERKNDRYILELRYEKLQFKLAAPRSEITFNSDTPVRTDNIYDRIYSKLIGRPFTMIMDIYGKIDTVQGVDSLGKEIVNALNLKNPMMKAQLIEDFKGMFGNKTLKGNIEMLTNFFPKHPVHVSDTWSTKLSLNSPIPATFDNTWELTDLDSAEATIKGNTLIESINGGAPLHIGNMAISYDVGGAQTTIIHIHPKTGWILSAKITSSITGTIKVEKSPRMPKGLEIPFKLKTNSEFKSL
jgi:hypothetical protein